MRGQIAAPAEQYWQGEAKELFVSEFNAFISAYDEFARNCEALNDELEKAGKSYNSADAEARRLASGLPD
jgi:WXG100 family type VII secretion target